MRVFNAFQIVAVFAIWPWGIAWLFREDFDGAKPLAFLAAFAYLIGFVAISEAVYYRLHEK